MKAAIVENGQIVIINRPEDIKLNGKKGAVVEVLGCGLCGSDIVKFRQNLAANGTVLGHEIVARIKEIDSDTGFKPGDVIVSSHHVPCGRCEFCQSGSESMCAHFKATNIVPGGFSEYVFLSEEHLQNVAHKKPEHLTDDEAAFYEPLGCCVRAIRRAGKINTALVVGFGSIGNIMAQALKAFGVKTYGYDVRPDRMAGFEPAQDAVDAVFMTSGADAALDTALKSVRDGGKIIVFSSTPANTGYANNEIYYRELTVLGSYSPTPADLKTSLDLLAAGKVDVKGFSTIYDFEHINQAFADTIENKTFKAYIKIR